MVLSASLYHFDLPVVPVAQYPGIFWKCPYAFGAFLALGLSFTLVIQALINMAVTVNLFPVTGVTLPLVSMRWLFISLYLSFDRNYPECGEECGNRRKGS